MKITKLILHKYLRLALSNIETFTYTPEADVQVILGTNGSGKSSIIREASPLPSHHSNFGMGGYKYIEFLHNGKRYVAESKWVGTNFKHFFTEYDGENVVVMNNGGTATAQRDMVKDKTGLTPEIFLLLIGANGYTFTDFSTTERRQWLTRFSPTDMTFAFKLFNDFRTASRDATGAFKHIANRISVETEKLVEMGDVSRLETQAKQMREELNTLMVNKEQGLPRTWDVDSRLGRILNQVNTISKALLALEVTPPIGLDIPMPHTVANLENEIANIRVKIGINESALSLYTTEYVSYESFLNTMQVSGANGIGELTERLEQISEDLREYRNRISRFEVTNTAELKADTEAVSNLLDSIFSDMPDNYDKKYNQVKYKEMANLADETRIAITRRQNSISQMETRLEHLLHTEDSECPKCQHTWKPGVKPNEEQGLKETIAKYQAELIELQPLLKDACEYVEQTNDYMAYVNRYRSVVNNYPRLQPLWDSLSEDNMFYLAPSRCLAMFRLWVADLNTNAVIESLVKQQTTLNDALQQADQLNQGTGGHIGERAQSLDRLIHEHTDQLMLLRIKKESYEDYRNSLEKLGNLKAELVKEWNALEETRDLLIRVTRDQLIDGCIEQHQNTLAIAQHAINQKSTLEGIVNDHKKSLTTLGLEKECYELLVDALSPTSGFIAEQLMGSIETMVHQQNAIINAIWTYELNVLPCGFEDNELNYRFPMTIELPTNRAEDVSDGSSAQKDIINLAFRLLGYSKLGLVDFPLFLDEVGASFDEQHRYNLIGFIHELIQTNQHSQVFMISHYASAYGSFLNAETVVVSPNNVTVPDSHNQNVTIEYIC